MNNHQFSFNGCEYVSSNDLVSVYECADKSWRVSYYPFSDKDRGLTKDEAFRIGSNRLTEIAKAAH